MVPSLVYAMEREGCWIMETSPAMEAMFKCLYTGEQVIDRQVNIPGDFYFRRDLSGGPAQTCCRKHREPGGECNPGEGRDPAVFGG